MLNYTMLLNNQDEIHQVFSLFFHKFIYPALKIFDHLQFMNKRYLNFKELPKCLGDLPLIFSLFFHKCIYLIQKIYNHLQLKNK